MSTSNLRTAPAYQDQVTMGAKFGDFAGWSMPLEYSGGGVLAEHDAVRRSVGLFDVSHMGTFRVHGPGAADALNEVLTNDINRISDGRAQYSLLCNDAGGVVDDLFLYRVSSEEIIVVPNAANASIVMATAERVLESADVRLDDLGDQTAIFAVQGPRSAEVLTAVGLSTDLAYLAFEQVSVRGDELLIARTGYTGEFGLELLVPATAASAWWVRLAEAVTAVDGRLCGLGARDTLRTEMGYPLHGHELGPTINPLEAGLSWAIGWDKQAFPGRRVLLATRDAGIDRKLVGLKCLDRGIPRADMAVLASDSTVRNGTEPHTEGGNVVVGRTTSGTHSPTVKVGIALAFVNSELVPGGEVIIDVRGRHVRAEIVTLPFVDSSPR